MKKNINKREKSTQLKNDSDQEEIIKKRTKSHFNALEVIVIMIITAICSITITIKVSYVINNTKDKTMAEADLIEFNETYQAITSEYYDTIDREELVNAAIEGMFEYLDDPYSVYMDEETTSSFTEQLEGEYVGMGGEITLSTDGKVYVTKVFDDGPAQKAGLKVNDIITKIAGNNITGKTLEEISSLIKGKEGTSVKLTIERGNTEKEIEITRGKVDIPSVSKRIITKDNKKIGIINISIFASNTYEQFVKYEKELEKENIDALIIDIRGNSGGYLDTVTSIAKLFLNEGDIIYQLDTKGEVKKVLDDDAKTINLKTALLVDKGSASASEILTAALKENINAEVIGVTTYGKGKVQKTRTLSSGAMIKYTTQNWLTPNGKEIDGVGIKPTIEVKLNDTYYDEPNDANDNQLQTAISTLLKG